jgi:carbon-monoxide dehydrogenase large subunit
MVQVSGRLVGSPVKRTEDLRLVTGRGTYVDNIKLPGLLALAVLRSPHPHARITRLDVSRAAAAPGVAAVFTGRDLLEAGLKPMPCGWQLPGSVVPARYALAVDRVRYVGEPVAAVVADSRYRAWDLLELIDVEYEPLPAVVDQEAALRPDAPRLHDGAPDNVSFRRVVSGGDWEQAVRESDGIIRQRFVIQRLAPSPMEPRATTAWYQPESGHLTLWVSTQAPHLVRQWLCEVIPHPEHKVRVISGDVGGGFGAKIFLYPEDVLVAFASLRLGRPVRWVETRSENFLGMTHGRDHVTYLEVAYKRDGKILGLKVTTYANIGAYVSIFAMVVPGIRFTSMLSGTYAIPNIVGEVYGVFTNTVPVDAYRGAGRPEAAYYIERAVDLVAAELGLDPTEVRRRNFIPPFDNYYRTAIGTVYDSGDYPRALEKLLELADYPRLRAEQERLRREGRLVGIGLSTYVEVTGAGPSVGSVQTGKRAGNFESALVRVHPSGKVTVYTGAHATGQGHETTFAQLVADRLGIPFEDVEVVHGDTAALPYGLGSYGSRTVQAGGSAIYLACDRVIEKARRIAAHLLEAAEADVVFEDGRFFVRGAPGRAVTFQEVAREAYIPSRLPPDFEPGLEAVAFFDPSSPTYPFGAHLALVEVDPETGAVKLLRYVAVDDCGRIVNPMLTEGLVHGGVAQGVGQVLWEQVVYDENGYLLTGSFLDYAVPVAEYLPSFETEAIEVPSPANPLGAKGIGESGTIGAPAAVANAVLDALKPLGIRHIDTPLTPERVWRAIRAARAQG